MTTQSVTVACPGRPPPTAQLAVPGSGALGAGFRGRKRPGFIRACGLEGTRPGPEEQLARRGYGRGVGAREGTGSQGSGHRAGWGRARGSQCASFPTGPASPLPACPTRSSSEGQCPQALSGSQAQAQSPRGPPAWPGSVSGLSRAISTTYTTGCVASTQTQPAPCPLWPH